MTLSDTSRISTLPAPLPADALVSLIGPVVVVGEPAFINGLNERAVIPGQRGMIISAIGIMISK